jgi:aspartate-semialdehyde dehydrogenase
MSSWPNPRLGYSDRTASGNGFNVSHYAGNAVPHNGKTDESGFSAEERKLVQESRKILDFPDFAVSAQCCRVAVAVGHYLNTWLTLSARARAQRDRGRAGGRQADAFVRFYPGSSGDGLSALSCVQDRDRALVGRCVATPVTRAARACALTMAADNLRLGAATNAIRIASRWFHRQDAELNAPGN